MRYFEIEIGECKEGYGYQVHEYAGPEKHWEYIGCEEPKFAWDTADDAEKAARKSLDRRYGKRSWKQA